MVDENGSFTSSIIAFIVTTLIVLAIIAAIYYFNQLRNGKTLTPSQINSILVFLVIVGILAFIMWIAMIYYMFSGSSHHDTSHHEPIHHSETITHHQHIPQEHAHVTHQAIAPQATYQVPQNLFQGSYSPDVYPGTATHTTFVASPASQSANVKIVGQVAGPVQRF